MKKLLLTALIAFCLSSPALAEESIFGDPHDWMIRVRAIDVHPDSDSSIAGLAPGTEVDVDRQIVPEIDFTYFFDDHLAAELIVAVSRHSVATTTGVNLGNVLVIPPQLTFQYHFLPDNEYIRPYAGVGGGYLFFVDENPGAVNDIDYDDGFSFTLQIGADFPIDENWSFNADLKRIYHNVDATINGGAITADVDLDPWVIGFGVGYRF